MRHSGKERGAYLTVFLSLSLPVILSLFFALLYGAKMSALRLQAECAADASVNACMAEYSRALQEQYDLFYIDTSYGTQGDGTAAHLRRYMEMNLSPEDDALWQKKSFTCPYLEDLSVSQERYAMDGQYASLRQQIYAYMTADPAADAVSGLLEKAGAFKSLEAQEGSWHRQKKENDAYIRRARAPEKDDEEGEKKKVKNPARKVDAFRNRPILAQVLPDGAALSEEGVGGDLFSFREIAVGSGREAGNSHDYPLADTVLLNAYMNEKLSCYGRRVNDGALEYQLEYILFGRGSDADNLEMAARRLLLVRECANCIYIFQDEGKKEAARVLALAVSTLLLSPELEEALAAAILFAWAYMESVRDVRTLLSGGSVPLMKTSETWKTSVEGILSPSAEAGEEDEGLDYRTYLLIMLFFESMDSRCARLMDMMEADVRKKEGRNTFRMDRCMDSFSVSATVGSSMGYRYSILKQVTFN